MPETIETGLVLTERGATCVIGKNRIEHGVTKDERGVQTKAERGDQTPDEHGTIILFAKCVPPESSMWMLPHAKTVCQVNTKTWKASSRVINVPLVHFPTKKLSAIVHGVALSMVKNTKTNKGKPHAKAVEKGIT